MEPVEIACPHCGGTLRVTNPKLLGRKVKCPKCRDPFTVPSEEDLNSVTADEELEAVGSGVGSKVGMAVGSGVYSHEDVGESFNFTPSDNEESFDISEEDSAEEDYEEEEEEEAVTYREKGYIVREENGKKRYYVARSKNDFPWGKAALIGGPIAFLVLGALLIFWSKGYFGGSRDGRQDATRFSEFGRHVEENVKWVPETDNRYQPGPGMGNGPGNGNSNGTKRPRRRGY